VVGQVRFAQQQYGVGVLGRLHHEVGRDAVRLDLVPAGVK
jgi:hypothetical protein